MKKQISITYNGPLPKIHAGGYSFKRGSPVLVFEPVHPQIVEKILRGAKPIEPIHAPAGLVAPEESPFTPTEEEFDPRMAIEPTVKRGRGRPRKDNW